MSIKKHLIELANIFDLYNFKKYADTIDDIMHKEGETVSGGKSVDEWLRELELLSGTVSEDVVEVAGGEGDVNSYLIGDSQVHGGGSSFGGTIMAGLPGNVNVYSSNGAWPGFFIDNSDFIKDLEERPPDNVIISLGGNPAGATRAGELMDVIIGANENVKIVWSGAPPVARPSSASRAAAEWLNHPYRFVVGSNKRMSRNEVISEAISGKGTFVNPYDYNIGSGYAVADRLSEALGNANIAWDEVPVGYICGESCDGIHMTSGAGNLLGTVILSKI